MTLPNFGTTETFDDHAEKKREAEPGPWQNEPDKAVWTDEETGLPCMIVRGPMGALCGYVGVYPGHPWHRVRYNRAPGEHVDGERWEPGDFGRYDERPEGNIEVHGGLTYSEECGGRICHIAKPGEPEPWWFGFDCAHTGDLCPYDNRGLWGSHGFYCGLRYVVQQVQSMARQLAAVGAGR